MSKEYRDITCDDCRKDCYASEPCSVFESKVETEEFEIDLNDDKVRRDMIRAYLNSIGVTEKCKVDTWETTERATRDRYFSKFYIKPCY